jgi:hypothetical protein
LKIVSHAKNVGFSRVAIQHQGTSVRIYAMQSTGSPPFVAEARWAQIAVLSVFRAHRSIESREPVEESLLLELPQNPALFYKIELKLVSGSKPWTIAALVRTC